MRLNIEEVEVRVKVIENRELRAIISLNFGDFVVKGFRISVSRYDNEKGEQLWVVPPSYQSGGKYHPMFFIPNKELWKKLEEKIVNEYERQRKEHFEKRFNENYSGNN